MTAAATILVVHGHDTVVRILRNLLRQLGFTSIDEANGDAAALAKLRAKTYSVVVSLDTCAEEGGCADLFARVQAEDRCRETPVVLIEPMGMGSLSACALKNRLVPILGPF